VKSRIALAAAVVLIAAGWLLAAPQQLGGRTAYVTTHGISMQPRFHTGDLAVMRPASSYHVGDVVAYHSHLLHTVVMHRIVAARDGRYTFKGDNNSWLDPERPTRSQLIGKLAVRIPRGGIWLRRLTSPPAIGLLAFALLAVGGTVQTGRRRRKRARMSRHAASRSRSGAAASLPPGLQIATAALTIAGLLAIGLAALSWTRPVSAFAAATVKPAASMTFSYTATVPKTAAYDGTTVTSPDTVFRKLARDVDVHFAYRGSPGTITVTARLSTPSGWHSTIPLADPTHFFTARYTGTVRLHLTDLDARARAAAKVTGVPSAPVNLTVTATVDTAAGRFAPTLPLALSPLELSLVGDPKTLMVSDDAASSPHIRTARTLNLLGHGIKVATARTTSLAGLLAVLLAAALLSLLTRPWAPATDAVAIRRRYASLLVAVEPTPAPPGRPVVDVMNFRTLVRVAERYGLLILHWTRSNVDTYLVHDDATTYRYRTGTGAVSELTGIDSKPADTPTSAVNDGPPLTP